jgi:hypothetical protein
MSSGWRTVATGVGFGCWLVLMGCSTLAKQGYSEFKGAQSELKIVGAAQSGAVKNASGIEFKAAKSSIGPEVVGPTVLQTYDAEARKVAEKLAGNFKGKDAKLVVDSDLLYYQGKGITSGGMLLTHVRVHAGDKLVLDTLIKTESESFRSRDEAALTRSAVEALGKQLQRDLGVIEK